MVFQLKIRSLQSVVKNYCQRRQMMEMKLGTIAANTKSLQRINHGSARQNRTVGSSAPRPSSEGMCLLFCYCLFLAHAHFKGPPGTMTSSTSLTSLPTIDGRFPSGNARFWIACFHKVQFVGQKYILLHYLECSTLLSFAWPKCRYEDVP